MANELILVVEDNDKNRKLVRDVLTFRATRSSRRRRGKRASISPKSDIRA